MEIHRGRGVSLWRQIEMILEREIRERRFKPGDRLPPESELSSRFRVNRHTVRRALGGLQEKSLLSIEQGRGSFVQSPPVTYAVSRRTRFNENLIRQKISPGGTLLRGLTLEADEEAARYLAIGRGQPVVLLDILREADRMPLSLASHYFPLPRFEGMVESFSRTGSITASLKEFGVNDYTRQDTRITARMPTREEADILSQSMSRPVLVGKSVNIDDRGIPVDFGSTRYAADRVQIMVQM